MTLSHTPWGCVKQLSVRIFDTSPCWRQPRSAGQNSSESLPWGDVRIAQPTLRLSRRAALQHSRGLQQKLNSQMAQRYKEPEGERERAAEVATSMAQPEQMTNKNKPLQSSTGKKTTHILQIFCYAHCPFSSLTRKDVRNKNHFLVKGAMETISRRVTDAGCTWHVHFHLPVYQSIRIIPTTRDEQHQMQWAEMLFYYQPPVVRKGMRLELLCILPGTLQCQQYVPPNRQDIHLVLS